MREDRFIDDTLLVDHYFRCHCGWETDKANNPAYFYWQELELVQHQRGNHV